MEHQFQTGVSHFGKIGSVSAGQGASPATFAVWPHACLVICVTPLLPLASLSTELPTVGSPSPVDPAIWKVFTAALTQTSGEDDPEFGYPLVEPEATNPPASHVVTEAAPVQNATFVEPATEFVNGAPYTALPASLFQGESSCRLDLDSEAESAIEPAHGFAVAANPRLVPPAAMKSSGFARETELNHGPATETTLHTPRPQFAAAASWGHSPEPVSPDQSAASAHAPLPVGHESGKQGPEKIHGGALAIARSPIHRALPPAVFAGPVVVVKETLQPRREASAAVEVAEASQQPAIELLQQADRSTGTTLRTAVAGDRQGANPPVSLQSSTGSERPLSLEANDQQSPTSAGQKSTAAAAAHGAADTVSHGGTGSTAATTVLPQVPGAVTALPGLVHPAQVDAAGIAPRVEIGAGEAEPAPEVSQALMTESSLETEESSGPVQSVEVTIRATEETRVSLRFVERGSGVEVVARTNSPELGRALGEQLSELSRMSAQEHSAAASSAMEPGAQSESGPSDSSGHAPRGHANQQRGEEQQQRDRHLLRWLTAMDSEVIAGQQTRNGVSQ